MILFLAALLHWGLVASACAASFRGLGDLPGGNVFSVATGVSADGSVVVGYSSSTLSGVSGYEAFRWTVAHGMVGLGDLPGGSFSSFANAVSADGMVVVGYSQSLSGDQAFRWTQAGGLVGLGDLPGGSFLSIATGVSGDGDVVVGYSASGLSGTRYEAFRWTTANGMEALGEAPHGLRDLLSVLVNDYGLNLAGWRLCRATALSFDGTIMVGYGTNPAGQTEVWIVNLKPPVLEITRTGNHVLLSWKTGSPNFILEQTSALALSNRWEINPEVVSVVGDHFEVTHSPAGGQQFFRLRKP